MAHATPRRHPMISAALAIGFLLLLVPSALAQGDDDRYGPDIIPAGKAIGSQRIYVVQPGDTLWDLAERLFGNPWQWPLLWSFNPQVTNPHWIFPGDVIYLDPPVLRKKKKLVALEVSRYSLAPKDLRVLVQRKGFIPEESYRESGIIRGSREERDMLARWDEVYVEFTIPKKIRPGERYTIYREERDRPIEHPVTGALLGYPVRYLGEVRVLKTDTKYVKALVTEVIQEIRRGDRITTRQELYIERQPVPNEVGVDGTMVAIFKEVDQVGEHDYVFIDRGINQGVKVGNRFVALQRGDGWRQDVDEEELEKYPWENVGEMMVLFVYNNHSVALVTRTNVELKRGVRVRMVKGY